MNRAKELLDNVLMRTVIGTRVDSLWRMLDLAARGRLPPAEAEGATGELDNKGALFVPGGLVFDDSDRKPIPRERAGTMTARQLRNRIADAMRFDNATLIFHDGVTHGVNLDNGFFADVAGTILASRRAALKRRAPFEASPLPRIDSDAVTRSHSPLYVTPPYGSRTRLSSCVAVCLIEARMYYEACRKEFGLRSAQEEQLVWNNIRDARKPVLDKDKQVLAPPCVVVCHNTRYRDRNLVGITRLLGFGKFGEFGCLTFERVTAALLAECGMSGEEIPPRYLVAEHEGIRAAAVLRVYEPCKPGKRHKKAHSELVALEAELGIKLAKLEAKAKERYQLPTAAS